MAKRETAEIDPRSEETVLYYTGPKVVPGAPARDLHGGDLARIAYVRTHRATEWDRRDEEGNAPELPKPATQRELAALVDELHASGAYRKTPPPDDVPHGTEADETTTDEPAAPAEG